MRQVVYLRNQHLGRLLEIGIELVRASLELELLNGQFHWCEGIVDLVRYLPRHSPPSAFTLGFRQLLGTLIHLLDQHVIALDQCPEFIVVGVVDMVVLRPDFKMPHLVRQHRDRCRHAFGGRKGKEKSEQQHDDIRR